MAKKVVKIEVAEDQDDTASLTDKVSAGAGAPASKGMRGALVPEDEVNDTIPKSSCALWSVLLLLIIILLAVIGSLFYLKTKKFSSSVPKVNLNINSSQQVVTSGEEVTFKLTESQIQSAINTNDASFPLKKATVKVNADKIILSGKTSNSFWGVSVEVSLIPRVDSGKIVFDITDIKSAGVTAPKSVSDIVNKNLGQYLDGLSSSVGNIEVTSVKLDQGFMTVTGRQR